MRVVENLATARATEVQAKVDALRPVRVRRWEPPDPHLDDQPPLLRLIGEISGSTSPYGAICHIWRQAPYLEGTALWRKMISEFGGGGRNRTGVHGFAGRCMTTLPPRRRRA